MPWSNSWSGAGEVVASSVEVIATNGAVVASIDAAGNVTGQVVYALDDLFYQGTSLSTLLDNTARGQRALMFYNPGATRPIAANTETMLIQTTITYEGDDRQYYFHMSHVRAYASAIGNCWFMFRHRAAANGNVITSDPTGVRVYEHRFYAAGGTPFDGLGPMMAEISGALSGYYAPGTNVNVALSVAADPGVSLTFDSGDDWVFSILDMGPRAVVRGVDLYTAPTQPALQLHSFQLAPLASQSYTGSGQATAGSGANNDSYMYYGMDPGYSPNGVLRSHCWFSTTSTAGGNGLGSLSDMVGVASASVDYIDVFVYTDWWYQIAGGTLYIGWTSNGINHVSENKGSGLYDQIAVGYSGRNQGKWTSVKGTAIETAILNGTFQGITLGPSPYTDYAHYGYAAGQSSPNPPLIRAGYYK